MKVHDDCLCNDIAEKIRCLILENKKLHKELDKADNKNLELIEEINELQDRIDNTIERIRQHGKITSKYDAELLEILMS